MKTSGIDIVRHVWMADYEPLIVEPSAECPGYVRVLAKGKEAADFWGKLDVCLPREMALQLAAALTACAEEQQPE